MAKNVHRANSIEHRAKNKKTLRSTPYAISTFFASSKKGIGPVIAIALLIVVAVSSVIGFQTFFQSYQSSLESKVEIKSQSNILDILYVESNIDKTIIYVKSNSNTYTVINSAKIDNNSCSLIDSDIVDVDVPSQISVDCLVARNENIEIVLITDNGVFQETFTAK